MSSTTHVENTQIYGAQRVVLLIVDYKMAICCPLGEGKLRQKASKSRSKCSQCVCGGSPRLPKRMNFWKRSKGGWESFSAFHYTLKHIVFRTSNLLLVKDKVTQVTFLFFCGLRQFIWFLIAFEALVSNGSQHLKWIDHKTKSVIWPPNTVDYRVSQKKVYNKIVTVKCKNINPVPHRWQKNTPIILFFTS